ncbi:MAG: uridine kinase [Firmicutes bacterium]|nr:uridine kinase [Bacillota bacterium]MBQ2058966.1 uridine kinase [Bacillota bacterium]MBQ4371849.1 uridine kinase [Bacillota bacterium]
MNRIIGFCGGSGSGKTTLAERIAAALGDRAIVINMDSFYKKQVGKTYEERTKTNYDHPDAFDAELFISCLKDLKEGRPTEIPVYDFTIHNRSEADWVRLEPRPVIIADGIMLFAFPEVVDMMDLKIFVDTQADVRILRRMLRDVNERGRSMQSVVDQYLTTVKPMHDRYIEPYKAIADIIVPEGGYNTVACDIIVDALEKRLAAEAR